MSTDPDAKPRPPVARPLQRIPYPDGTDAFIENRKLREQQIDPSAAADELVRTGQLPSTQVPPEFMAPYLVCLLVDCCNEIIDSFNVIVDDLEDLPAVSGELRGRASIRLQLLVRVFWSEAYRGKEVAFRIIGGMKKQGFIEKDAVAFLRELYEEQVDPWLEMRHRLQHGDDGLAGPSLGRLKAVEALAAGPDGPEREWAAATLRRAVRSAYHDKVDVMTRIGYIYRVTYITTVWIAASAAGVSDNLDPDSLNRALGLPTGPESH